VNDSPIEKLLAAIDGLDLDAVMALVAPDVRVLVVDGRRAEGADAMREVLEEFVGTLRSTNHRITARWHVDDVWIAEMEASYELRSFMQIESLPRAVVLREGPDGIAELRFYGAHEHPVNEHDTGKEWGNLVRGRWIPPL
jgi:hypothetical protein